MSFLEKFKCFISLHKFKLSTISDDGKFFKCELCNFTILAQDKNNTLVFYKIVQTLKLPYHGFIPGSMFPNTRVNTVVSTVALAICMVLACIGIFAISALIIFS